jgi:hypothetical protein
MSLFELLQLWPVWAQLLLFLTVTLGLTHLTGEFMHVFGRYFMNALAVLIRGWPPKHIDADDDDDTEDDEDEK